MTSRKLRERLEQASAWIRPGREEAVPDLYARNVERLEAALQRPLRAPPRLPEPGPDHGDLLEILAPKRAR